MIDPDRLRHAIIPEVRQHVTPRDVVFYALSVGLGADPVDQRQLDFVDAHRGLRVFPTMSVVLAHPGFWLAKDTGVDVVRLVHGEQWIEMHGKLPITGEIISRSRVTGLIDKGAEKGALLYWEKEITDAGSGQRLATTGGTTVLRGDGGFGGPSGPVKPVHPMPEAPPAWMVDLPTRPEQALYYRLNGDDNPLHADPAVAQRAGFPRPILHGLCTLGVVAHALLRQLGGYDEARFKSLALRFSAPVYPGETIRTEIWADGSFRARAMERDVIVVNNGKAVFG